MKISPSQIATYRDCPRKWAWDKLDGIRSPPNASAALGSAVHAHLEQWLEQGIEPDDSRAGTIARRALAHLPPPGSGKVETRFVLPIDDDLELIGTVDLIHLASDGTVIVHDHKTTSSLAYRKRSEDLAQDAQAIIYAAYAAHALDARKVSTQWLYIETKHDGAKVKLEAREWTLDEIGTALETIIAEARNLVQLRKSGLKALDIEPDVNACEKYGGCFYRPNCNLTPTEKIGSLMKIATLQEKVQNGSPIGHADAAPPMRGAFAKLRAAMSTPEVEPEPTPAPAALHPAITAAVMQATSRGTINAPEAPDDAELEAVVSSNADLEDKLDAVLAEPVKRGRGRPPKARAETDEAAPSIEQQLVQAEARPPAPIVHERTEAPRARVRVVDREEGLRIAAGEHFELQSLAELETAFAHRPAIAVRIDELRLLIKAAL